MARVVGLRGRWERWAVGVGSGCVVLLMGGCGMPGAPQPPTLRLAEPVTTLTASRAGDVVTLRWTNPTKTTDGVTIAGFATAIEADLCRVEAATVTADCQPVQRHSVKPGSQTEMADVLPPGMTTGPMRALRYAVVLRNAKGRTAGLSNVALTAAGQAPGAVRELTAQASGEGVVLHWLADGSETPVRLERHLLKAPLVDGANRAKKARGIVPGGDSARSENEMLVDQALMVDAPASSGRAGALDRQAAFDAVYRYTAQRVLLLAQAALGGAGGSSGLTAQTNRAHGSARRGSLRHATHGLASGQASGSATSASGSDGSAIAVASAPSAPVMVDTQDVFPPAVPKGLVATYSETTHSVDLSWAPDMEPDLAGYVVERSLIPEGTSQGDASPWTRLAEGVAVPGYSDAQVKPGREYRYAVRAVDRHGNTSAASPSVSVRTEP